MCAVSIIALVALFLGASPPRATARAIQRECPAVMGIINGIAGCFLQYCQENGGLPVVGDPLTPARRDQLAEGAFVVQGFERNRFELHPDNQAPDDVLLGRLGVDTLHR